MNKSPSQIAFDLLTAEDEGRVCKDIPESACRDQPQNFLTHVTSLTLTKSADGLIDPKLILSWLLTTLGAPILFVGLLVPVREAGALLPQLFTAGYLRSLAQRKWVWAAGSFVQGLCALGMAFAALTLQGAALGMAIVALLAVLALARSACSVSYKDVLGKTVDKSKRGTATGTASMLGALVVILYALLIASGWVDKILLVVTGLFSAALLWVLASLIFTTLTEEKGATEGGGAPFTMARQNLKYLIEDRQLQRFIATRGLLISTALAPPFMVALSAQGTDTGYGELGWLLLASAGAGISSSYVWGRLSDRSSRRVLLYAGFSAAVALLLTVISAFSGLISQPGVLPVLLFGLMIAYQGVRLGRSTHLVDMADENKRAIYTALSNTLIGLLLLAGGVFSAIAQIYGELPVIALLSLMSLLSVLTAWGLKEVQH